MGLLFVYGRHRAARSIQRMTKFNEMPERFLPPSQLSEDRHVRPVLQIDEFQVSEHGDFNNFALQFFTSKLEAAFQASVFCKDVSSAGAFLYLGQLSCRQIAPPVPFPAPLASFQSVYRDSPARKAG